MGLIPKGTADAADSEKTRRVCHEDKMPLLRWFFTGCPDFGDGLDGDDAPMQRMPGTLSIGGIPGQPRSLRLVLRDPSGGVVSLRTYTGDFEDLLLTLENAFHERGIEWNLDKFAKRR